MPKRCAVYIKKTSFPRVCLFHKGIFFPSANAAGAREPFSSRRSRFRAAGADPRVLGQTLGLAGPEQPRTPRRGACGAFTDRFGGFLFFDDFVSLLVGCRKRCLETRLGRAVPQGSGSTLRPRRFSVQRPDVSLSSCRMNAALYAEEQPGGSSAACIYVLCYKIPLFWGFWFFSPHPCVFWKFSICLLYSLSGIRHLHVYETVQNV